MAVASLITMSRPFKLYRLQQIDSQIDWMQARLQEIETALKEDQALREAGERAEQAEQALNDARKALKKAEQNVQQQRLKIEQSESTLYSGKIQNPKELQDIQNEVAALTRYLDVLEDRQLESMLSEEEAETTHQLANDDLEKQRVLFDDKNCKLCDERDKLQKDLERLEGERQAATSSIQPEDLELYTKLRKKRRGVGVAKVTDRACSACGTTLNTALLHAARSPNHINCCDSCGRILYTG
jgi:predicted  nucleic acid-binding Zn-ribbon protein